MANTSESIEVYALSISDALGYRGQHSVAQAVADRGDYRIIGGHMVRLLLHYYPTPHATLRSTVDADTALDSIDVVEPVTQDLLAMEFIKEGGNLLYKDVGGDQRIEINLLLSRTGPAPGVRPQSVEGVGEVDTLPELGFAMMQTPLILDVSAHVNDDEVVEYQIKIPDLEAAVVLKAHSWKARRSEKDLTDLHSLLEIREAHPSTEWKLGDKDPVGFRRDTVRTLQDLGRQLGRKRTPLPVPNYLDKRRFAALIAKHIAS